MYALDTNVLVRYLVQDDKEQAQKAAKAIESLTPDTPAFISCIVLCEVNWVLKTAYKISKEERILTLRKIISVAVFEVERLQCCTRALKHYEKGQADFSDYLIQDIGRHEGYETLLTFDAKALKDAGFQKP